jgi:hypothetical protein
MAKGNICFVAVTAYVRTDGLVLLVCHLQFEEGS